MGDLPRYHELGDVIAGLLPFNLDELPINIRARVVLLRCEKYLYMFVWLHLGSSAENVTEEERLLT